MNIFSCTYLAYVFPLWASLVSQLVKNLPAIQEIPVEFMGQEDSPREGKGYSIQNYWATMQEAWVWSLGWGDPLEEDTAAHSSILSLKVPLKRGALRLKESDTMVQLSTTQCISFSVKCLLVSFMLFLNGIFSFLLWIWEFFIFSKFCQYFLLMCNLWSSQQIHSPSKRF